MKKKIVLTLSILLILGIVAGCGCNKKQEKDNTKDFIKDPNEPKVTYKQVGNLKIGTASITINDDKTYLEVSIKNDTNKDITVDDIIILIKDSNGKTLKTLTKELGEVKSKGEKTIKEVINEKLTSAASFDFQIK